MGCWRYRLGGGEGGFASVPDVYNPQLDVSLYPYYPPYRLCHWKQSQKYTLTIYIQQWWLYKQNNKNWKIKNDVTTAAHNKFIPLLDSVNSKHVGINEATEMPKSPRLPHYGEDLTIRAPTCVNKQAPFTGESLRIVTSTLTTWMRIC